MLFLRETSAQFSWWWNARKRIFVCACFAFILIFSAVVVPKVVHAEETSTAQQAAQGYAAGGVVGAAANVATNGAVGKAKDFVQNGIGSFVLLLLANILQTIVMVVGTIMLGLVWILIQVAQYNSFVDAPVVVNGWTIVRDVTNMFFILVLLLIAFGTMLGLDQYSYKNKHLSGLLIMAIVVNFTRTICGVLIDFGQVVMLTFVYGFKEAAGGNFANMFQLTSLLTPAPGAKAIFDTVRAMKTDDPLGMSMNVVLSMSLALIAVVISCAILLVMTLALIARVVTLWLLIVMSPLAFFLRAVPTSAASKYYGEWWSKFTGQIVFGPLMAFFLWLSLLVSSGDQIGKGFFGPPGSSGTAEVFAAGDGLTAFGSFDKVAGFMIGIVLLAAGQKMATQIAGESGGMAKSLAKKAGSAAVKFGKAGGRAAANVGIGPKDALTGERQSLASMGRGFRQDFVTSKLGRGLGLDKEFSAAREKKRDLANVKDPAKRAGLVNRQVAEDAKKFAEKSTVELEVMLRNPSTSLIEKRAAMEALATKGAPSMKNLGPEGVAAQLATVGIVGRRNAKGDIEYDEKDKDAVRQFKSALKAGGNMDASHENAEKAGNWFRRAGQEKQLEAINGNGEFWKTYAENLDANQFEKYSDKDQQKILDRLMTAGGFDTKIDELNRKATNPVERVTNSKEENEKLLAAEPTAPALLTSIGMVARLAKSGALSQSEIEKEAKDLQERYAKMGGDGMSEIAQDLAAAQSAMTPLAAADRLASAAEHFERAINRGGLSAEHRVEVEKVVERGKSTFGNAENEFGKALAPLPVDEKFSAARQGASKAMTAINILSSGSKGTLSKEVVTALNALKDDLKAIRAMGNVSELDAVMESRIASIAKQVADIKNKI